LWAAWIVRSFEVIGEKKFPVAKDFSIPLSRRLVSGGFSGAACAPNSVGDRDSAFGDSSAMFVADTIS